MQRQQRQLGSLARAGFTMAISQTVIGLEDMDAAEMLIGQLEQGKTQQFKHPNYKPCRFGRAAILILW